MAADFIFLNHHYVEIFGGKVLFSSFFNIVYEYFLC